MTKSNRGHRAPRYGSKLPRRAGFKTGVAFDKNELKSTGTLAKYRTGYTLAWNRDKDYMKGIGLKAPETYNPRNQQGGHMFALPGEVKLSGRQAGQILRHVYKSGVTQSQLESVSKMLSFAYQLTTGKQGNYDEVKQQWDAVNPDKLLPPTQKIVAEVSVEPSGLKTAFTTEFDATKGMPYPAWCVGLLLTWDHAVCGSRSVVDLDKIKKSRTHTFVPSEGWMATVLKGGRAKLENKKGTRPWSVHRVCCCPKGKHQAIPENWQRNNQCNPTEVSWCTTCPLNAFKTVRSLLSEDDYRTYPAWLPRQQRYSKDNLGEGRMRKLVQSWLDLQGGNPDHLKFDSNSGRKALGKWCAEFQVPYHKSFEVHGDLWCTWKKHYEPMLKRDPAFLRRTQSTLAEECCAALRMFARGIGRGREVREDPKDLSRFEKLLALDLRARGFNAEVAAIMDTT